MTGRLALVLLLAAGLGACSVSHMMVALSPDRIITGLGLPQRGFATDALYPEDSNAPPPGACTLSGCPQAPQFCVVRGYRPGTDPYARCIASVEQNLRHSGN